jgi:hypothetical protein
MGLGAAVRQVWERMAGVEAAASEAGERKTVAAPAAGGDDAEQLGLATPGFQDVALAPAVLRKNANTKELLIAASAVLGVVGTLGYDSAEVLFTTAVGVVLGDDLYEIESCVAMVAEGAAYAYRLTLQAPVL